MSELSSVLPYRVVQKGMRFYPQFNEKNYVLVSRIDRAYSTEEGARKFLQKQATYRLRLSVDHFKKYGKPSPSSHPDEQQWLNNIDKAPLVQIGPVEPPVAKRPSHQTSVMKYIVVKSEDCVGNVHELPVMFPYALIHKEMKESVWRSLMASEHRFIECVGAGFCNLSVVGDYTFVSCYGESESLGVKSRFERDNLAFDRCQRSESSTIVERYKV